MESISCIFHWDPLLARCLWYSPAHNSVEVMKTRLSSSSLLVVRDITRPDGFPYLALIPATWTSNFEVVEMVRDVHILEEQ